MSELADDSQALLQRLFALFAAQLQKDFEGAGFTLQPTAQLPVQYPALKIFIALQLQEANRRSPNYLSALLYRVDISEQQLKNYMLQNNALFSEELLAELIIKRVLQKVVFKANYKNT